MKLKLLTVLFLISGLALNAQPSDERPVREEILINNNWLFHLGHATDRALDFGYRSNPGASTPVDKDFNDREFQKVDLPHDWAVDLPYASDAPASQGYKCIGYRYPENSVGWYRYHFFVPGSDLGRHIQIRFDGIYRDSEVFCNGIYLGHEKSGYLTSVYDITQYLDYGSDNVITVRADASTPEASFYGGAGIYRDVTLVKTSNVFVPENSVKVVSDFGRVNATASVSNRDFVSYGPSVLDVRFEIWDADGNLVSKSSPEVITLDSFADATVSKDMIISIPHMWDFDDTYMYTLRAIVSDGKKILDSKLTKFGIRDLVFDPDRGFVLNNRRVKLQGVTLHQDAAGVGTGMPRELWRYRLTALRQMGVTAIRCANHPASPAMLDLCDEIGILVIDENRTLGIAQEQLSNIRRMVERDFNHPCLFMWSVGTDEKLLESSDKIGPVLSSLDRYIRTLDPTRPSLYAYSGQQSSVGESSVTGYNYLANNNIESNRQSNPSLKAIGTQETTGTGTRGKYVTDTSKGILLSQNRSGLSSSNRNDADSYLNKDFNGLVYNVIERGYRYYEDRNWLGGCFFDSGCDYRGMPAPLDYPATMSQTGLLDYCGYMKDEAYFLQAWGTNKPVLHICPEVNGQVWIYTNCKTVRLYVDGIPQASKSVPQNSYVCYNVKTGCKKLVARASYGRQNLVDTWPVVNKKTVLTASKTAMSADGQDIIVVDIESSKLDSMLFTVSGPATILGWGNGDPAFKEKERPAADAGTLEVKMFSGRAQVILRSVQGRTGQITVNAGGTQLLLSSN